MRIDHIAIWTKQLEKMKHFYGTYFQGKPGEKYINPRKNFESYFVEFDSGTRLELMGPFSKGDRGVRRQNSF